MKRSFPAAMAAFGWFLALLGMVFHTPGVRAQAAAEPGDVRLVAKELTANERIRLSQLASGTKAYGNGDKALLDKAAEWHVFRVTWKEFQERQPPDGITLSAARSVYDVLNHDLYPLLIIPDPKRPSWKPNQNQLDFMVAFTDSLLPAVQKVLKNPRPIARINAALILLKMSESGQEKIAPTLRDLLQDSEQLDAVKLYALKGLANIFNGEPYRETEGEPFVDKQLESDCIKAVVDFLHRKPTFDRRPSREEIDAYVYLRKAAIRTLGTVRYPAVAIRRTVISRPALELLRIVRKDGIQPRPTFAEQVEAAIGLCKLQSRQYPDYQLGYVGHELGQFFVEFGEKYEAERNSQAPRTQPWRNEAARLDQALQILEGDSQKDKVQSIISLARTMLQSIQAGNEAAGLRALRAKAAEAPSETSVYRNQPESVIQAGQE